MIPALVYRGFGHGSGIVDPTGEIFIINIPKNASSYILDWSSHHGWRTTVSYNTNQVKQMIVVLRDPLSRWLSGISQYLCTYILSVHGPNGPVFPGEPITSHDISMTATQFIDQYNPVAERLIMDVVSRFDDHVWPQHELIDGVLPDVPKKYFLVDEIDQEFPKYLNWRLVENLDRNTGQNNHDMKILQAFFRDRLSLRPELVDRIKKHYRQDYELLTRIHK